MPVHLSVMVELGEKTDLFYCAHKLVDAYPKSAVAWYAVGCYYFAIAKYDMARRYFRFRTISVSISASQPLSLSVSVSVSVSAFVSQSLSLSLCLSVSAHTHTLTHSHTLLITCTCCYDEIKGTQDQDFSCSFSAFVSVSAFVSQPQSHSLILSQHFAQCVSPTSYLQQSYPPGF